MFKKITNKAFQREIEATDRQIDTLVYQLYGLTEEVIRIVEGTCPSRFHAFLRLLYWVDMIRMRIILISQKAECKRGGFPSFGGQN
jgi:hypothetical protein